MTARIVILSEEVCSASRMPSYPMCSGIICSANSSAGQKTILASDAELMPTASRSPGITMILADG